MSIVRNFNLYLNAGNGSAPYINVNQYDQGEQWVFTLYKEDGTKYTPSTGAIVGIKADNRGIINTGTVDADGRVVINETQQMTAAAGIAIFELLIDGDSHGTANFLVNVEQRPGDNADLSDSDLSLIQQAVDSAEVIVEVIGDGDPSEVIGEHVDAWLDNHPEATTTVVDGAITAPKINQSLWDKLLVSEEASGAVASFDDGADDVPVSSLKVALEPIQTGSGDPSPSNVRPIIAANGKNKWSNGAVTGTAYVEVNANVPTGTYTFSAVPTSSDTDGTTCLVYVTYANNTTASYYMNRNSRNSVQITSPQGNNITKITFYASDNYSRSQGDTFTFADIMLEEGTAMTPYQPYQGIMVDVKGRNLYPIAIGRDAWVNNASGTHSTDNDVLTVNVTTATSSGVYSHSSAQIWKLTPTLTGTYSYSLSAKASANGNYLIGFTGAGRETKAVTTQWQRYTFTGTFDGTEKPFVIYGMSTAGTIEIKDFMLELGSEAHEYVPYASASYPYTLGQSVYGGTVDLATGVLTVTHGIYTVSAVDSLVTKTGFIRVRSTNPTEAYASSSNEKNAITNNMVFNYAGIIGFNGNPSVPFSFYVSGSYTYFVLPTSAATDLATANTWFTNNPTTVVYPLATPQTVQLTPQEVKTLLGYNNISSTGTVDVIYHADTKHYVDKMTAVDNNIIAPTEKTFTATRNYTTNDLVIVNDTLYKVTANIASGSAITPNSNVQQTTLSALIKALS